MVGRRRRRDPMLAAWLVAAWLVAARATAVPVLLPRSAANATVAWVEFARPDGASPELLAEWRESHRLE